MIPTFYGSLAGVPYWVLAGVVMSAAVALYTYESKTANIHYVQ